MEGQKSTSIPSEEPESRKRASYPGYTLLGELRECCRECALGDVISLREALAGINNAKGTRFVVIIDEWDAVARMLAGDSCRINPAKFQNDMTSFKSRDDILTLLIHLGYMTYDRDTASVWIPNEEVKGEFVNAIEDAGWKFSQGRN